MSRYQKRRFPRTARLNEVIREVLAEELERLSDPRLGFVTLTGVEVTGDISRATVYYSVLGEEESRRDSATALRSATPHLRSLLGRQVRVKSLPTLVFEEDPAIVAGARVEEIIKDLHAGGELGEDLPAGEDGSSGEGQA
ncbi:MAG: 30S ribosome-binding factor RbfA [Acidimicrobiia bacterium]